MKRLILAVVPDMFFASKIRATAEHLDVQVRFIRNAELLLKIAHETKPDLIIVDLQSTSVDPMALAQAITTDNDLATIPLLGFLSHVEVALQQQAKQSGFTHVLPRSAFSNRLAEILGGKLL